MRRILVVDDDRHVCRAICAWLKRYGFRVAVADGGTTGLAAPRQFDIRSDDHRCLHAQYARLRIDQGVSRPRARRAAGASRCLRKPFTPIALLTVIT